ncbi:MAG: hypothetical protein KGI54_17730 [Pseudomonadota bacterium]|nr:hypothetical protein [Pseudomonadota bacterium]
MMDELTPTHAFKTDKQLLEEARETIGELYGALMSLLIAKDEKEYHGDTPVYQSLKKRAWREARAAIAKHSTKPKEQA